MVNSRSAIVRLCAPVALVVALAAAAAAQTRIGAADIDRLQNDVFQASSDLSRLRSSDPDTASRLQNEIDDLREEVIYLKVKLRREGNVTRAEFNEVRDRISDVRSRARVDSTSSRREPFGTPGSTRDRDRVYNEDRPARSDGPIPVGQEIDVRLQTPLSSDNAQVEDRFEATTVVDLYSGNRVLIPAGSSMRGTSPRIPSLSSACSTVPRIG